MKKNIIYLAITNTITLGVLFAVFQKNSSFLSLGSDCQHGHIEHYAGVKPTTSSKGRIEHWACCDCHKAFYDENLTMLIDGSDTDRSIIDIDVKTNHSWYGKENVKNDEIANISTDVGDVCCLEQTDWSTYPNGLGSGTYYYYVADGHPSVYIDAEEMSWTPDHVTKRNANNNGYSTFKFKNSFNSLSKITFDYKYWDLSYEPDANGNHISLSTDVTTKIGVNLIPDNKWHTFEYTFDNSVSASKVIFDIYHFVGQLYISNMHYNLFALSSGTAYDISVDSTWANKHIPQFGLPSNVIDVSTSLYPQSEGTLKIIRNGTSYNAATTTAPLITKDNDNQYTVDTWWLMNKSGLSELQNGDVLVIEGKFLANCDSGMYYLDIERTEIIFVSTDSYAYAHYVNHIGNVVTDFVTSTKTTYRWFMTSSNADNIELGASFKPTSTSNFKLNGINIANTSINGLYTSSADKGEVCVLDTDQGFSPLKIPGAKLEISGYFVNSNNPNNYIYIHQTTFYFDGNAVARIYNDVDTSDFHIGTWNGNHHFTNDTALSKVAEAGYDNVLMVNPIWNPNFTHTMDLANSLGVKFYCDPRTWNSNTSSYNDWDGIKPSWMDNAAIGGLVVMDEPSIQGFATAQQYQTLFNQNIGGNKKMFVNLNCSCVSETALYGSEDYSTNDKYYDNYAKKFVDTVSASIYGFDSYGLMDNGTVRKSFYCDLDVWSHLARDNNKELWYSVLSSSHKSGDGFTFSTPTLQTMRWKTNLGMAFGTNNLIHYMLASSDTSYNAIMNDDGSIKNQDLYDIIKTTNNEVRNWDEIYSQYTWAGYTVHDTGKKNKMFQYLKFNDSCSTYGISSIKSEENLIIGCFKDPANQNAYMIVNAGQSEYSKYANRNKYVDNAKFAMESGSVTLKFNQSYNHAIIIKNGVKSLINVGSDSLTLSYDSYDGMFVIPF